MTQEKARRPGELDAVEVAHRDSGPAGTDAPRGSDAAEGARRARFGKLPERIRPEDVVEEKPATVRDPARDAYDSDEWLVRYCG